MLTGMSAEEMRCEELLMMAEQARQALLGAYA